MPVTIGALAARGAAPGQPGRPEYRRVDGGFDRPFAFPAGSNNVEVRSPEGGQRRRVQFYDSGSGEPPASSPW